MLFQTDRSRSGRGRRRSRPRRGPGRRPDFQPADGDLDRGGRRLRGVRHASLPRTPRRERCFRPVPNGGPLHRNRRPHPWGGGRRRSRWHWRDRPIGFPRRPRRLPPGTRRRFIHDRSGIRGGSVDRRCRPRGWRRGGWVRGVIHGRLPGRGDRRGRRGGAWFEGVGLGQWRDHRWIRLGCGRRAGRRNGGVPRFHRGRLAERRSSLEPGGGSGAKRRRARAGGRHEVEKVVVHASATRRRYDCRRAGPRSRMAGSLQP